MNILQKIITFIGGFSSLFYLVRTGDYYSSKILLADLGGIPILYSTIGMIFSIIAAFAIQKEWDNWNNLVEAVKDEVDSLEELWIWTGRLPQNVGKKIKPLIVEYLKVVIREGWQKSERGERSEAAEQTLSLLRNVLLEAPQYDSQAVPNLFPLFGDLLKHRRDRSHFSARHMPGILRYTLMFATGLLIFLPFFIGIKNIWLGYIFTLSIATLAFTVYSVVTDLDYPLRPGGWHLTTKDYEDLLRRIEINPLRHT